MAKNLNKQALHFSVITGDVIRSLIANHSESVYEVIKSTYLLHGAGQTVNPNSYFLRFPDQPAARIIALPAALCGDQSVAGIKWIGSQPANINQGLPRASAVTILNDYETKYPFACLESATISATRTACSAVLAAEYLHRQGKQIDCLAIVGTGVIAQHILQTFIAQGWQIEKLCLFDQDKSYSKAFASSLRENKLIKGAIEIADQLSDALKASDMVVFTTTAGEPYVNNPALFAHGSTVLNVSLRDLAPDVLLSAENVVDDVEHVLSANTSPHLTYQQCGHKDFIVGSIDQLLRGELRLSLDKVKVFSPMGMGILDIALAYRLYQLAKEENVCIDIDHFF